MATELKTGRVGEATLAAGGRTAHRAWDSQPELRALLQGESSGETNASPMKRKLSTLSVLTALLAGCAASPEAALTNSSGPQTDLDFLAQAQVGDPEMATALLPLAHLDDLAGDSATTIPVATLESDYETLFGSLSAQFGVTLNTPQVVADIDFIASQPDTGNFDLRNQPILNNPLGVTGVEFQPLEYDTTVPLPQGNRTFHVSGALLLPQGISKAQIRGVLVYFHGTTFSKAQVPSVLSNGETQLAAQVFASQGYIVAMPDYVGQGVDWQDVHPYVLYPKVSAQTAADLLVAAKSKLAAEYGLTPADPALKLFSVGFSEGGAYSLWFNQYLASNPGLLDPLYVLTHSIGIDGAYNTSDITYNFLFNDVSKLNGNPFHIQTQALTNQVKPILSADAFLSYAAYSLNSDFASVFQAGFFAMQATPPVTQAKCNVANQQLTLAQAFALPATNIAPQIVSSALGKSSNNVTYPGPNTVATSTKNSLKALVAPGFLTAAFQNPLKAVMTAADVDLSNVAPNGVSILTLDEDSVVVVNNFDDLLNRYPGKIRTAIKVPHQQLQVLSPFSSLLGRASFVPADHLHAPIYEFLYALHICNQL